MSDDPDVLYKIEFKGTKYSSPSWEVTKLKDFLGIQTYVVTSMKCQCSGYEHRRGRKISVGGCRHLRLRDYYESHNRPECLFRISGSINIFQVRVTGTNNQQ